MFVIIKWISTLDEWMLLIKFILAVALEIKAVEYYRTRYDKTNWYKANSSGLCCKYPYYTIVLIIPSSLIHSIIQRNINHIIINSRYSYWLPFFHPIPQENINNYLKGCYKIGISSADLFITSDLFQKRGIPQVVQNITSVARFVAKKPEYVVYL